ncbi:MAG: Transcriptional regulator, LacI family [uncultured Frankineae bacterium]|uniref:Transcriptional regulator, LacI family n=1 Tax=uncultured Frankineae bacterium TaxID=437475 RepID=A0A6J4KI54_9ACTN|nr:MAG: Transcriptional regulator, LacI family [uncultured Frankineae bacterium]
MGVRMKEVASRAGVSVKTVSNVVNGYLHVAPTTRERVQQAIDEMGYRPNLSARSLRSGRTGIIAVALPRLDEPYFAELAAAVIEVAEQRGCTVLVDQTDGLREREQVAVAGIRPDLIDGLILSPLALGADDLVSPAAGAPPLVLLGERVSDTGFDHVAIDNVAAARTATDHLLSLGRRRLAAIGGMQAVAAQTARLRLEGFAAALQDAGRTVLPGHVQEVEAFRREDGARAMDRLLDLPEPPDAVYCFSDLLALGALHALHRRGVRVPQDVAVIGTDDIAESRFSTPTLSTVVQDQVEIATLAVEALLHRLDGGHDDAPREHTVGFELRVRESTVAGAR